MSMGPAYRAVAAVADLHGIPVGAIFSKRRPKPIVQARWHAILEVVEAFPDWSDARIGQLFGLDCSSIHYYRHKEGAPTLPPRSRPITLVEAHDWPPSYLGIPGAQPHIYPPSDFGRLCQPSAPSVYESIRALVQHFGWQCYASHNVRFRASPPTRLQARVASISPPKPSLKSSQDPSYGDPQNYQGKSLLSMPSIEHGAVQWSRNEIPEMAKP